MRRSGEEEETEVGEKERMRKGRRGTSKICHIRLQYLYDCTLTGDSFLKDICVTPELNRSQMDSGNPWSQDI